VYTLLTYFFNSYLVYFWELSKNNTCRLPQSGNLPVLFLLSSQKSTFCPLAENYELDRKMDDTFRMGTTSSTTMQRLGEIEQRAPAVGAKIWCLYVCLLSAGLPPGDKLPVLNLRTGQK